MTVCSGALPVIGDIEVEVTDMRSIFRENYVAGHLPWCEPEGKVWNIVELELCMNPAEVNRISTLGQFYCVLNATYKSCVEFKSM